jgi:ketosteroid isomerase-like protein
MPTVATPSNREAIDQYWRAVNARDWDSLAQLLDPDYVWEMPQSGERVRGVKSNREMNDNYPAGLPDIDTHRITGSPDRWVTTPSWTVLKISGTGDDYITESRVSYPDNSVWHAVDIFHFRDGKIRTQVAYFAPTLEAAEWRARWVERF